MQPDQVEQALRDASALGITISEVPWADVLRAWQLSEGSLRYADALYVAAAERLATALLTADSRIARSGAPMTYPVVTVTPDAAG